MDSYGGEVLIFAFAIMQMIGFAWVYGVNNLIFDINFMLNTKLGVYWKFCWGFFVPVSLSICYIWSLAIMKHEYPTGALGKNFLAILNQFG